MAPGTHALALTVRLHGGRYHGEPEWPPAPARVFQALVAGAGPARDEATHRALAWLERLAPPVVAAPRATRGESVVPYVPNNDLDAVEGDPDRVDTLRVAKPQRPWLLEGEVPFRYVWFFDAADEADEVLGHAARVCASASGLYQLGRGLDMAWAEGVVLEARAAELLLDGHRGVVLRPSLGGLDGVELSCPCPGTLTSLDARHAAPRIAEERDGRKTWEVFAQAPKPRLVPVTYGARAVWALYDLRDGLTGTSQVNVPLAGVGALVVEVRNAAASKLQSALPAKAAGVEAVLVGRRPGAPDSGVARARIVALPSIGHEHADHRVRRLLVELPTGGPIHREDLRWAFDGLALPRDLLLVPAEDTTMTQHYGVGAVEHRVWRSVTPVALPAPKETPEARRRDEVVESLRQSLRHAGVTARLLDAHVQREPYGRHGDAAAAFAVGTRFEADRLWHCELTFAEPVRGPLVLGDGRFLGLGLLAPATVASAGAALAFVIVDGLAEEADPAVVARALRRAVMARVQRVRPGEDLEAYFTGHAPDGRPTGEPHLSFLFDPSRSRLVIVPPHVRDGRGPYRAERVALNYLAAAMAGFCELRAGAAGKLVVEATGIDAETDPLLAPAAVWGSLTSYVANRHTKRVGASAALAADIVGACREAGLPEPEVRVDRVAGVAGIGLVGRVRLRFPVAVRGPLVLGRSRHVGGGVFAGMGAGGGG